tara:strand:+ start:129 stop:896 length:768 start_codon:yes stop_codon:yes gene_type:complete
MIDDMRQRGWPDPGEIGRLQGPVILDPLSQTVTTAAEDIEMQQSGNIEKLAAAMAEVNKEIENPKADKRNPHYDSKYVDLADLLDTVRKIYAENGLVITQRMKSINGKRHLVTQIMHTSGQWIAGEDEIEAAPNNRGIITSQAVASAITYARRIGLQAITGLAGDGDDDGNAASAKRQAPQDETTPIETEVPDDFDATDAYSSLLTTGKKTKTRAELAKWFAGEVEQFTRLKKVDEKAYERLCDAMAKHKDNLKK